MVANLEFDHVREAEVPSGPDAMAAAVADILVERGALETPALERARHVAQESGKRLDGVLVQLGLVKERVLAETEAAFLGVPLIGAESFPQKPLFADRLKA